jgi:ubiquitin-protein ligase
MKMNNKKRLEKELLILKNKPIQGISAFPINNNLTEWKCIIKGPEKTPY